MPEQLTTIEQLSAVHDQIDAILKTADDEKRQLSDDELTQCQDLQNKRDELAKAVDREKTAANLRAAHSDWTNRLGSMSAGRIVRPSQPDVGDGLKLPPLQHRLKAFAGPDAQRDAYFAGMHILACGGMGEAREWALKFCRDKGVEILAAPQSEGSNTHGGYLVFPTMEAAIIKLREEYGVARREFRIKVMPSEVHSFPRRKSGLTAYYVGENTEITASSMQWENITLTAKKLAVLTKMSSELSEDAVVSIADELADEMAWQMAYQEDLAAFIGDGTSTYGGMTGIVTKIDDTSGATYAGSIPTLITGNTAFSTLDLADFTTVVGALPEYARVRGAAWYISRAGWAASMLRLIEAAGGQTGAMIAGEAPAMFLGYPVRFVQVMNSTLTAQTSTVIGLFGNLQSCCFFGTRRGVTITRSDDRYFEYDQIGIKGTERYAVTCTPGDPAAPTTAAGPVIAIKTPSS